MSATKRQQILFKGFKLQERSTLGRLLSAIEADLTGAIKFLAKNNFDDQSLKIGITGPPGAGKSTLIKSLIRHYRKLGKSVALIAVDPSSPRSGGALLGDRVRLDELSGDAGVFVRSLGLRGSMGGISSATQIMATFLGLAGFDLVLIETVGVGQAEYFVKDIADTTAVLLVPESGDYIQLLKAGILEIADVLVVNKADRPGASEIAQELGSLLENETSGKRELFLTVATDSKGIEPLADHLVEKAKILKNSKPLVLEKSRERLKHLLLTSAEQKIAQKLGKLKVQNVYQSYVKIQKP